MTAMNRTGLSAVRPAVRPAARPAIRAISTLCVSVAILALGLGDFGAAQAEATAADINSRIYQQLEGNPSAEKIQTVSGQMYIAKENIDSAVINDALAAMLEEGQGADAVVSVRRATRLNFEIHFKKNSADLTPESREGLDALGEVLASEYLDTRFVLGGHTDLDGDAAMNGPLSQARADSARNYLVARYQITSDRLVAKGYGMSEPLREVEESAQDKLYNRRVDLRPIRGEAP
jgi:outer membrane protein OmpA-like peptidoglycan-associated protein